MIRADQIPKECFVAYQRAFKNGGSVAEAIAAAINAWPRLKGCWDEDETGLHRCLLLPLPQTGDA